MKLMVKVLLLIGLVIGLFCYIEISTPIPEKSCDFNEEIQLKKGTKFRFEIYIQGEYKIEIVPIDQTPFNDHSIELSLTPTGFFGSQENITLGENDRFGFGYFRATANSYEVKIENIDPRLVDKVFQIRISEAGATASKNLYFKSEFRPYYELAFDCRVL